MPYKKSRTASAERADIRLPAVPGGIVRGRLIAVLGLHEDAGGGPEDPGDDHDPIDLARHGRPEPGVDEPRGAASAQIWQALLASRRTTIH